MFHIITTSRVHVRRCTFPFSTCLNMAEALKPELTLHYRGKTHKISLEGTQANLQTLIEAATTVPPAEQTVLCKGKKLTITPDAPVADLNLVQRAILLRRPAARSKNLGSMRQVVSPLRAAEARLLTLEGKLKDVQDAVARHTKGFLDKDMTIEALEKDAKEVRSVEEGVMRIVEEVDGMAVPDEGADVWRAERRALVKKAQGILVIVDGVQEKIGELKDDRWGEVESRRGKG